MKYEQKELRGLKMNDKTLAWAATVALVGKVLTDKNRKEVDEWNKLVMSGKLKSK